MSVRARDHRLRMSWRPIEFTAQYACGPQVGFGTEAMVDGRWEVRGNGFAPSVVTVSDQ